MCFWSVDPFIVREHPSLPLITSLGDEVCFVRTYCSFSRFLCVRDLLSQQISAFGIALAAVVTLARYISRLIYPTAAVLCPLTSISPVPSPSAPAYHYPVLHPTLHFY